MPLKNLKIPLSLLFLFFGFSNLSYSQDGNWYFTVSYYNPHANDNVTYSGIERVQLGTDGRYYALVRLDYSYDTSNGPSARRTKDHQIVGIPYVTWNFRIPMDPTPLPTVPVSSDDGIPARFKTFGNNTTQYIWLEASSEDASNVYFNSNFEHVFTVAMMYSNDWLGLLWHLTSYNVKLNLNINDSFAKADVTP